MMSTPYQSLEYRMRQKRKSFHVLMAHIGILNNKSDLLAGYGADSTMELTESELDELIYRLKQMQVGKYEPSDDMRKWRSNVLAAINAIGVYNDNGDWQRVNAFLMDSRIAGKMLYEMTVPELKALHRKLLAIKRKQKPISKIEYSLN